MARIKSKVSVDAALRPEDDEKITRIANGDIHYEDVLSDSAVDISLPDKNKASKAVLLMFPEGRYPTATEGIHRYIDYLDKYTQKKVMEG